MKEQIISLLISKVGLSWEKATQAVDTVFNYINEHPHQLTSYLAGIVPNNKSNKLGGFFN